MSMLQQRNKDRSEINLLDRQFLIRQADGDEALLGQIITLFLQESPRLMTQMRIAIHSKAPEELHAAAHTLTGSLGLIGAKSAISLIRSLCAKGRAGQLEETDELLTRLGLVVDEIRIELIEIQQGCPQTVSQGSRAPDLDDSRD